MDELERIKQKKLKEIMDRAQLFKEWPSSPLLMTDVNFNELIQKYPMVVVDCWAPWCGPCRSEMPYIQQIYEEWSEDELVLLSINVGESADDVTSFMQDNGLSFPVLLDREGESYIRYGALGLPTTLFIDKEGLLQDGMVGAFRSTEQIESILNQLD